MRYYSYARKRRGPSLAKRIVAMPYVARLEHANTLRGQLASFTDTARGSEAYQIALRALAIAEKAPPMHGFSPMPEHHTPRSPYW